MVTLYFSVSTISSTGNTFSTVKVSRWMRSILTSHKQMMWQMSPEDASWMNKALVAICTVNIDYL